MQKSSSPDHEKMLSGPLRSVVWTGGVACGKSSALAHLLRLRPETVVFDADKCVHELLATDRATIEVLSKEFGNEAIGADGGIDRDFLREVVFADETKRRFLEATLHPRVRQECLAKRQWAFSNRPSSLFVADIPLHFDRGANLAFDASVVVAASPSTQIERLQKHRGIDSDLAGQMLAAQMPIEQKVEMANYVIWNDGDIAALERQVADLDKIFQSHMSEETEEKLEDPDAVSVPQAKEEPLEETAPEPQYDLPSAADLVALRDLTLAEVYARVEALPIRIPTNATKAQLVFELTSFYLKHGVEVTATGVLEKIKNSYGMLRDEDRSFRESADDVYVASQLIQQYDLRPGQRLRVRLKPSHGRDKYPSTREIISIDGVAVDEWETPKEFDSLTAMFPDERFVLERGKEGPLSVRVVDLVAPLGKGQRGLIVAPPRGGKTILLKQIAKSLQENHPNSHLIILLLDERPEEVTDFEETVDARVYASTFDENHKRHGQVADLTLERAKRLVEQGENVVLLLDSLTRLARGHNSAARGGPIGSGGVSPQALQKSRKFFNAARNCEEGGSLTILATALVETENRMDEVIFEEFKGTGNMEIKLDQMLAERRIWPAIHIQQSGTRNDDRLYHPEEMQRVLEIRRQIAQLPVGDAIVTLLKNLERTGTNAELLLSGLR